MSILVTRAYICSTYEDQIYEMALIKQCVIPRVSLLKPNQNTQNKSYLFWDENDKICT